MAEIKCENDLIPYIIGDSMIFNLDNNLVQIGPISVKDLSIHDLEVPENIIFRPNDYLTIEFNFFHLFFIHKKRLNVYALKDQIVKLKKIMQISLFAGKKDWAAELLYRDINTLNDEDKQFLMVYIQNYLAGKIGHSDILNKLGECFQRFPESLQETFRLFLNQELAKRAFAIFKNNDLISEVEDFDCDSLCFIEYQEGKDICLLNHSINITGDTMMISNPTKVLYQGDRKVRFPTTLLLTRFKPQMVTALVAQFRYKLIENGIAQIGSGDGMAYTPNQDTSCTLIRQNGNTFLLDASVQSILKSAYLGVNVYEDDIVALLTHGCHGDHGAGLYFIAKIRTFLNINNKLKIFCHPIVLDNYVEKCAYVYQVEYEGQDIEKVKEEISSLFQCVEPENVVITPFNTHSVPTTGFYFSSINFYVTGDMSGAELERNKVIKESNIDITKFYLEKDLQQFDKIKQFVVDQGFIAMECGQPPIHIPKDLIIDILGGEDNLINKINENKLFLYHTSGQKDASEWVVC